MKRKMRILRLAVGLGLMLALGLVWPATAQVDSASAEKNNELTATLSIDPGAASVAYSPRLFGGFIEHFDGQIYGGIYDPGSPLSDKQGFRRDVIAALKELKLAIVRWPGGCFASGYHWRDGVGAPRCPVPDPVWGVTDPNTFGTDEFINWCRRVGCEPYLCSNAGNGTPEEMRDWVAYCNGLPGQSPGGPRAPGKVAFWSIGNENWGGHEIGARTPQEWGPLVRQCAELMRAVDPQLTLLAAATPGREWTLPLLKAAGPQLQYIAIHNYWLPCWQNNLTPDYLTCIMHSEGPESTLRRVIGLLDESGYRGRIQIAFDEWNLRGWHHPGFPRKSPSDPNDVATADLVRAREKNAIASQYSMADALFAASFLNACLRHAADVGMANIAPIVNTRGPLFVHSRGLVKRTTFHTLALYANRLQPRVLESRLEAGKLTQGKQSIPVVDAVVTAGASGKKCTIALVNRHPSQPVACTVNCGTRPVQGKHRAWVLAGDSTDAYNDIDHPDRVVPRRQSLAFCNGVVMLPAHSLALVEISRQ